MLFNFLVIKTNGKIFIDDKQDLNHIFFAKTYSPSFFEFDDYRTQNK